MTRKLNLRTTRRRLAIFALAGGAVLCGAFSAPAEAHRIGKVHVVKQRPANHRHATRIQYRVGPLRFSVPVRRNHCHRRACNIRHIAFDVNENHIMCRRTNDGHFVNNRFGLHVHILP